MPLPNLLVAGVPKAGTSTVHNLLSRHPEVFMAQVKEPHFFTYHTCGWPRWAVQTMDEYRALFEQGEGARFVGEGSTWYAYSREAAESIRAHLPDVKVIIMLRNPADRAYSNWTFNVTGGWESITDFREALRAEDERREQRAPWHLYYFHAGLYHRQIKNYFELFGRDRVGVFLLEDLKRDREATMADMYAFIGVEPAPDGRASSAHNRTYAIRNRTVQRFMRSNGPLKQFLRFAVPRSVWTPVRRLVVRRNRHRPAPLSPALRAELLEAYRPDVQRLQALLGRDLMRVWYGDATVQEDGHA